MQNFRAYGTDSCITKSLISGEALASSPFCPVAKVVLVMGGEGTAKINDGTWFQGMFTRNISQKRLQFADISARQSD
jgi:hypothetical protein